VPRQCQKPKGTQPIAPESKQTAATWTTSKKLWQRWMTTQNWNG
jgi:hypothetical protein